MTKELDPGTYQLVFMYGKDNAINKYDDIGSVKNISYTGVGSNYVPSETYRPDIFDEDLILCAKWIANSYTYPIEYITTTGKNLGADSMTNNFDAISVIEPQEFAGYTSPEPLSIKWDSISKTIVFTYTPIEYTISYTLNDGINPSNTVTKYTIEDGAINLPTPTRDGHNFKGWYLNQDFEGEAITSFSSSDLENKAFYAS